MYKSKQEVTTVVSLAKMAEIYKEYQVPLKMNENILNGDHPNQRIVASVLKRWLLLRNNLRWEKILFFFFFFFCNTTLRWDSYTRETCPFMLVWSPLKSLECCVLFLKCVHRLDEAVLTSTHNLYFQQK